MKSFSKKGVLLFAGAMAVCAFVLPAVSSAASWGPIGLETTLTSGNLGFVSSTAGGLTSQCSNSSFTVDVVSAAVLTVTTGSFLGCTSTAPAIGNDCTTTSRGTNFHWTATAPTTTNIQIHGVNVDVFFEDMPLRPNSCTNLRGATTQLTGTLTGGHWDNPTHRVTFSNAHGLVGHPGTNTSVRVFGTLTDVSQLLTVLPFP